MPVKVQPRLDDRPGAAKLVGMQLPQETHASPRLLPSSRLGRFWFTVLLLGALNSGLAGVALLPSAATNLVCYHDFEHPVAGNPAQEIDLGLSETTINLVNGGGAMRTNDGAYAGSTHSLQTRQLNPTVAGNDDWKAGCYQTNGLNSLNPFSAVGGITIMTWVKPTEMNPNLNSVTTNPDDYYNAVGLAGLLSGTSEGHAVRALLEIIQVGGTMKLVALGRRIDTGASLTLAATEDWQTLIPSNRWTHLAATFDYDKGTMALYRNGAPLPATYTTTNDAWHILAGEEPDLTSATSPAGIKIGGSFPQNTQEKNPFNGRFDDIMFFNRALTPAEIESQYQLFQTSAPKLKAATTNGLIQISWPETAVDFALEETTSLGADLWQPVVVDTNTNSGLVMAVLPVGPENSRFFRLLKR